VRWGRIAKRVTVQLVLAYVVICVGMYVAQDGLIFHPTADAAGIEGLVAAAENEAFELEREDVRLRGALLLARDGAQSGAKAPALMYFGGNAEAVAYKAEPFAWIREGGAHVLLLPYRGYDGSEGQPGAERMRADALAAYDRLAADPRVDAAQIYGMGYSMGTGVATYLAHERELAGLVLVAPFRRLGEIAEGSYPWLPVGLLLAHDFDSLGLAPEIDEKLLLVHGDADTMIPIEHGLAIREAWGGPSELLRLEGRGHDGVSTHPQTMASIRRFLRL